MTRDALLIEECEIPPTERAGVRVMMREEIAERLATLGHASVIDTGEVRRLADAVRALPVIATCGECGWMHRTAVRGGTVHECEHPRLAIENASIQPDTAPPSWCPYRGKR